MGYEGFVASRYLWSKRRHPFVGLTGAISVAGIGVGVAALIVVLAVMNGFDEELKSRIIGTRSHLLIEKEGELRDFETLTRGLMQSPAVRGASPFVEGQALIQKEEWGSGVLVRGIDVAREKGVSDFFKYLTQGQLSGAEGRVAVGSELAKKMRLALGSEVQILSQSSEKPETLIVEGVFSSGMYEFDANLVYLDLADAQRLFHLDGAVHGVSVYLKDPDRAQAVKLQIQKKLGYPYQVRTWMDANKTLFGALELEKVVMFLILTLIILVACLNIAGTLTILVMDKTRDIGVLKALGASPLSLMKVFSLDGLMLGLTGGAAGFAGGMGLCALLKKYQFIELPQEIYYIRELPVRIDWPDTLLVLGVALALSLLCSTYPAVLAGRLDPVKALRYE